MRQERYKYHSKLSKKLLLNFGGEEGEGEGEFISPYI